MVKNARVFKLVIVGDGGVGKTTLTKVFCNNPYVEQIMTIGIDIHAKDVVVNGQRTVLQIWDISGQTQFQFMVPDFLKGAKGAILAYDRTRESSFSHLDFWIAQLHTNIPNAPIILISTKADQSYDPALNSEMGKVFAQKNDLIDFIETSAKISQNINLPFQRLLERLYNLKKDEASIDFLGPEDEFRPSPTAKTAIATPTLETPPLEAPPTQATPSIEIDSRIVNSSNTCTFCNSPLRQSQTKLKEMGKKVLCHNCFNLT